MQLAESPDPWRTYWRGVWRLAEPKISLVSIASIAMAAGAVGFVQPIDIGWLAATVVVVMALETAKNGPGDIFDYDSGTDWRVAPEDRTPFSGGRRVLVDGLLTRRQTWRISVAAGLLGLAVGLVIVLQQEPAALWFGLAGAALGWAYHAPPFKLAYRGLGEAAVLVAYGPLVALATYVIQVHVLSLAVLWLSLPFGVLVAVFLLVNEFPDHDADRLSDKRNLVVRLGKRRASRLVGPAYLLALGLMVPLTGFGLPGAVWWGALFVPPAVYVVWTVWRDPLAFHRSRPAQPAALLALLLYALGTGGALVFSGGGAGQP